MDKRLDFMHTEHSYEIIILKKIATHTSAIKNLSLKKLFIIPKRYSINYQIVFSFNGVNGRLNASSPEKLEEKIIEYTKNN